MHIPYGGASPAQLALIGGQVDFNFDNLAAASANIRSGRLKALAVTTAKRSSVLPELPTVAEAGAQLGLKSFDIGTWFGIFGPARLPAELTLRLNKAFVEALNSPEMKTRLGTLMAEPSPPRPNSSPRSCAPSCRNTKRSSRPQERRPTEDARPLTRPGRPP